MANSAQILERMDVERRAAPRYPLTAALEYRLLTPGQEFRVNAGRTVNMSRNGLLFETDGHVASGFPIELWIEWPAHPPNSERWLYVWGWVVNQKGRATAIAIRQYSFEHKRKPVNP